jgi:formate dehydrogenase (hydrogenase)
LVIGASASSKYNVAPDLWVGLVAPPAVAYEGRLLGMPNPLPMSNDFPRLEQPLVRRDGQLRAASWDDALGLAAAGFASAKEAGGSNAFGLFSCSKTTNELNFLTQKFARVVMGCNNVDSCNRT